MALLSQSAHERCKYYRENSITCRQNVPPSMRKKESNASVIVNKLCEVIAVMRAMR